MPRGTFPYKCDWDVLARWDGGIVEMCPVGSFVISPVKSIILWRLRCDVR